MKLKIMSAGVILLPSLFNTNATTFAATDKQNIIRMIRTQEDLNSYLEETGSDLGGDKITFELLESITFPKKIFKIQNNETVWSFKGTGEPVTIDLGLCFCKVLVVSSGLVLGRMVIGRIIL